MLRRKAKMARPIAYKIYVGRNKSWNQQTFEKSRNVIIMNSPDFATSNRMLFAVIKRGLDFTKHYSIISNADLDLILNERAFNKTIARKRFFFSYDILQEEGEKTLEILQSLLFTLILTVLD